MFQKVREIEVERSRGKDSPKKKWVDVVWRDMSERGVNEETVMESAYAEGIDNSN